MDHRRARIIPGLILIILGIAFLAAQYFEFGPGVFLAVLGLVFLVPYAFTRNYGMLVPGCILVGLGMGLMFDRPPLTTPVAVSIGLGLGFVAIYVIHLVVTRKSHWWPLLPGSVLILAGIAEGIPQAQVLVEKGWPLILIAIGLVMLVKQLRQ